MPQPAGRCLLLTACALLASLPLLFVFRSATIPTSSLNREWGRDTRPQDYSMAQAPPLAPGSMRPVAKVVKGLSLMEGAGVRITRTVGTPSLRNLDPYLMLDEIKCPAKETAAGFPDHPHRGFETCTIMLEGQMRHKDSAGNEGVIGPGGVQWMTAGRGIIHSEMPESLDGDMHGFQLWINLPRKDKMVKPRYQDYQAESIKSVDEGGGSSVRVLAGEYKGVQGPIKMRNPGTLLDVRLAPGGAFQHALPREWAGFAYVYGGSGELGGAEAKPQHALVLADAAPEGAPEGPGDVVAASAAPGGAAAGLRFLLVAGKPIREPVVQHGPFVMSTQEEIHQAFRDYQAGMLHRHEDNPWEDEEQQH